MDLNFSPWLKFFSLFFFLVICFAGVFLLGLTVAQLQVEPFHSFGKTVVTTSKNLFPGKAQKRDQEKGPHGAWHRTKSPDKDLTEEKRKKMKSLQALGYLSGYEKAAGKKGVTIHNPENSFRGLNLYVSGHAPEARLINMKGQTVHRWHLPYEQAFPETPPQKGIKGAKNWQFWRKFYVYPNGDLLAIITGHGLIKVDRNSNLIWARHNKAHHDLWVSETTGKIYVLTRKAKIIRKIHPKKPILDDRVTILNPQGEHLKHISLLESLWKSKFFPLVKYLRPHGDILHTNTLEILEDPNNSKIPSVFGNNHALVSFNFPNTLAVVDLKKEEVIWQMTGMSNRNHDPTLLDNGNLLYFDNTGHYNYSQVEEVNPATQKLVWSYDGNKENGFRTKSGGTNQRLPNGNTLITETEAGRAFEVTPEGEIVWEWFSPHRAGENNELVASLFEMKRFPENYFEGWSPTSTSN